MAVHYTYYTVYPLHVPRRYISLVEISRQYSFFPENPLRLQRYEAPLQGRTSALGEKENSR